MSRRTDRLPIEAEVRLRRAGSPAYPARVFDLSPEGCKVEFVERPALEEHVWVKFPGLESLQAEVRWIEGFAAGVRFDKPLHAAVFERLMKISRG